MTPTPELMSVSNDVGSNPPNMNEYLFERAVTALKRPRPILEIGTDQGASALIFMDALAQTRADTFLVTVDPWGMKPYPGGDAVYGEQRQQKAMALLSRWAALLGVRWHHFKMTSDEFLERVQGVGCWYAKENLAYEWGFVFLDGEHVWPTLQMEVNGLAMAPGGTILIDNARHRQPDGSDLPTLLERNYKGEMFHYNRNEAIFKIEVGNG